jgi:hypothetical protein
MRAAMILTIVMCLVALAADDVAVMPQSSVSHKPQATTYGTESITIPQMLSYQGKLTDTLGQPVPNSDYSVTLKLYTVPSGGSAFWNETQDVKTRAGLFSALLGSVTPIGSVPSAGVLYLGMAVGGGSELVPRLRIVSAAYAYKADTANYALAGGTPDNTWVRGTPDSVLFTTHKLGIARGGADNMLHGSSRFTHTNLGAYACTTGMSGQDCIYCVVGGGIGNVAGGDDDVIGGGAWNRTSDVCTGIASGYLNSATGGFSFVGGGQNNAVPGNNSVVGGGSYNYASSTQDAVLGGTNDSATGGSSVVGGGSKNVASDWYAAVCGGSTNRASGSGSCVAGGYNNLASGSYSAVAGGVNDTAAGQCGFATCSHSIVPSGYSYSAAFNGQAATASSQTRVGVLSKASGTFTIDHPLDPQGKILNHYFIEGPEMLNIYRGSVVLSAAGRAEVNLPDYFDALNRNPQVVLTGIGSPDVYLVEEVSGNRFTVGGKPGTKVNWIATGERKDVSAEVTRRMMPVEQPKTGALAGRMLDDDFLAGCMDQLVREGKAQGIDFRTAAGRAKYEKMKQLIEHR